MMPSLPPPTTKRNTLIVSTSFWTNWPNTTFSLSQKSVLFIKRRSNTWVSSSVMETSKWTQLKLKASLNGLYQPPSKMFEAFLASATFIARLSPASLISHDHLMITSNQSTAGCFCHLMHHFKGTIIQSAIDAALNHWHASQCNNIAYITRESYYTKAHKKYVPLA